MPYNLMLVSKSGYLHATVVGDNNPENIRKYLQDIQNACETLNYKKILIEANLTGPTIGTLDIFDVVTKLSPDAARAKLRIAYVDVNRERGMSPLRFAESTARNRRVNIRVFSSLNAAQEWLLSGSEPAAL